MQEYSLIVNLCHMGELLEALRNHQITIEHAPCNEQQNAICADLCRRAELLSQVVQAGDNLREAQEAYDRYIATCCDKSPAQPVKVFTRPL